MEIKIHKSEKDKAAEIISDEIVIHNTQDALDLMADVSNSGIRKIIIFKKNIIPSFFDLKTGFAGEILQKFVNYQMNLSIVGDYSSYKSESQRAFIYECNKGNQFFFTDNLESAKQKLGVS